MKEEEWQESQKKTHPVTFIIKLNATICIKENQVFHKVDLIIIEERFLIIWKKNLV